MKLQTGPRSPLGQNDGSGPVVSCHLLQAIDVFQCWKWCTPALHLDQNDIQQVPSLECTTAHGMVFADRQKINNAS